MNERPTFGSLFAGIGGIDLGLERAGWECRWQVEWDTYCQRVLAKHWPDVPRYGDITSVDWSGVERVDLLAGGFPCQPASWAGLGLAQNDERWLWPEFERAIRALRPQIVLVENVPGLLARGIGDVFGDLAALGYDAEWDCIPASALGAPHERDRVWIVAYPNGDDGSRRNDVARGGGPTPGGVEAGSTAYRIHPPSSSPDSERPLGWTAGRMGWLHQSVSRNGPWPLTTEPVLGRGADGISDRLDRLRALGNAVVPQVVEVIGTQLLATLDTRREP